MAEAKAKGAQRGNKNELELLMLILAENRPLAQRVMERIRVLRATSSETTIDAGRKKAEEDKANRKKFSE